MASELFIILNLLQESMNILPTVSTHGGYNQQANEIDTWQNIRDRSIHSNISFHLKKIVELEIDEEDACSQYRWWWNDDQIKENITELNRCCNSNTESFVCTQLWFGSKGGHVSYTQVH